MSADQAHADGHGHGHGSRFIQHHYDDAQHQFDSGKFGIWLFLAQEVLFFSALFVAYVLYRYHHPEIYGYAHKYLDVKYGAINTGVLIFSSMTAAWAVRAAQKQQRGLLIGCIFVTILCACGFLGIKYIEYSHKVHEQILFGKYFDPCVSSGGAPLLTKKNSCPGHQTSVWWEGNQALTGCYAELEIDQDPFKPGAQVSCTVREAELEPKKAAKQQPKKDDKGNEVKGPNGQPVMEDVKDKSGQPVMEVARDKYGRVMFDEKDPTPVKTQCPPPTMHGEHGEHEACWMVAPQPAVCRPGFYYTESCYSSGTCAKDWTRKVASKVTGEPAFLAPEVSSRWASAGDCEQARFDRNQAILKQKKADEEAKVQTAGLTVSGVCVRSNAVGFVVDHGDHEHRHKRAVASCAPPPKPAAVDDVFAEAAHAPKLGQPAVATGEEEHLSEHEKLYLGPPPDHTNMFFTIYFAMTGLHGIHVLVGVIVFIWLLIRAIKGHFTPDYFGPVDFAALYWHIVDLIWIFLFPLLYLIH